MFLLAGQCAKPDDYRCADPHYTTSDCTSIHVATICGAMCGKCKATQCKDSTSRVYELGQSWVTYVGQMTCTEKGITTTRGKCTPVNICYFTACSSFRWTM